MFLTESHKYVRMRLRPKFCHGLGWGQRFSDTIAK